MVEFWPLAVALAPIAVALIPVPAAEVPKAVEVDVDASDPFPIAIASLSPVTASGNVDSTPKPVITPLPTVIPGCPPEPSALPKRKSPLAADTPRVASTLVAVTVLATFKSPITSKLFW